MVHVIKNIPIEENHKVTDISKKILMKYGGPEEYLTDKYPSDYFSYFIDIGTRGIFNPWHINHIAANNPNMLCLGYEPDYPFYEELIQEGYTPQEARKYAKHEVADKIDSDKDFINDIIKQEYGDE